MTFLLFSPLSDPKNFSAKIICFRQHFGLTRSVVENIEMSPVCDHYVNFLLATTTNNSYEVGLATILPCFWIYAEVGKHIYQQSVGKNPYQDWIDSYASEEFEESVNHVIKTTDHAAADASKTIPHLKCRKMRDRCKKTGCPKQ